MKTATNAEKLMSYYDYNEIANACVETIEDALKTLEAHYTDMYDVINDYDGLTDKDIAALSRVLNGWDYDERDSNGLHNARKNVENDIDEYIARENLINSFVTGEIVDESALHDALIGKWQNKELDMTREDMAVHFGGMSWNHDLSDSDNMDNLEKEVENAGGWIPVMGKAIENWVTSCIGERVLLTASL